VDVACGTHGRGEESAQSFVGKVPKESDHSEDRGVDGRLGSKWILGRLTGGGGCRVDPVGSGQVPVAGCCEYVDEPSGSGARIE
jgi:hypothetical protein